MSRKILVDEFTTKLNTRTHGYYLRTPYFKNLHSINHASRYLHSPRLEIIEFILSQLALATLHLVSPVLLPVHLEDTEALAARWAAILLDNSLPLFVAAVGAASEEDDDHAEE